MILNTIIILFASLLFCIVVEKSAIYGYYKYIKHLKEYIDHLEKKSENGIDICHQTLALNDRIIKDFSNEINNYEETISHLEQNLRHSTAHILNLQTAFNECRDWFSNIEEDEDFGLSEVDYSDCSGSDALYLKQFTEELAMNSFERWFTFAKGKYKLEDLNDYEKFVDENLVPTLLYLGTDKKDEK